LSYQGGTAALHNLRRDTMTNITITRSYALDISFDEYREDHDYARMRDRKLREPAENLDEAVAAMHRQHSAKSDTSWVAFWIHETTVTVTERRDEQGRLVRETHTVEQMDAYSEFRTYEDWKAQGERIKAAMRAYDERIRAEEARLEEEHDRYTATAEAAYQSETITRPSFRERIAGMLK
jgi:hypothetical protein